VFATFLWSVYTHYGRDRVYEEHINDKDAHNTEHIITGPVPLSYDDISRMISEVTGRKITHQSISDKELISLIFCQSQSPGDQTGN